jgi:Tc toxin complex TcA C-terminal TcB-binding domain/Neuraminidase-like domain
VNNLLARKIIGDPSPPDDLNFAERNKWYQSQAIDKLANDNQCWFSPPAVLAIEETRNYFKSLKLSLFDIYTTLSNQAKNSLFLNITDPVVQKNLALEYLELTNEELNWLNSWIYKQNDEVFLKKLVARIPQPTEPFDADFNDFLSLTKLQKNKISEIIPYEGYYDPEEQNFYETSFINSDGQISKVGLDKDNRSEKIKNLSINKIKAIAFFTFLGEKFSIAYKELQAIFAVVSIKQGINDNQLILIAKIMWLYRESKLPISAICNFLRPLPIKEIARLKSEDKCIIDILKKKDKSAEEIETINKWIIRLSSSLRLTPLSLNILLNAINDAQITTDSELISKLYRAATLCQLCDISMIDLVKISLLLPASGYTDAKTCILDKLKAFDGTEASFDSVLCFFSASQWIKKNSFNIDMLLWIVTDKSNALELSKREEKAKSFLTELQKNISLYDKTQIIAMTGHQIASHTSVADIIVARVIDFYMGDTAKNNIQEIADCFVAPDAEKREPIIAKIIAKIDPFLGSLSEEAKKQDSIKKLSALWDKYTKTPDDEKKALQAELINAFYISLIIDTLLRTVDVKFILRLYKIAAMIGMLNLSYADDKNAACCDEISLLFLSITENNISFDSVQKLTTMKGLQKEFNDLENNFIKYFTSNKEDQKKFFALAGCDEVTFDALSKASGFTLPEKGSIESIYQVAMFHDTFKLLQQLNDSAYILAYAKRLLVANVANKDDLDSLADFTKKALIAIDPKCYDDARREFAMRTRDVLVDKVLYLYAKDSRWSNIQKTADLCEYLLLDVEMSGSFSTSYVVQGIASLQSYLQRCRLQIEPGVESQVPEKWWPWLEAYRVWEANRKVLLYPESYIEPDLRIEQSSEFKQLTQALLQANLDTDTVDSIFRDYLQKVEKLSQLIYCDAYCVQATTNNKRNTIFLFAHTRTSPYEYYNRTCQYSVDPKDGTPNNFIWSYWEKTDLKINTSLIKIIYAFNRLFIFWIEPKFKQTPKFNKDDSAKIDSTTNIVSYKIYYSYQHSNGTWEHPQLLDNDSIELESIATETNLFSPTMKMASLYTDVLQITKEDKKYDRVYNFFDYCLNTVKVSIFEDNEKISITYFNKCLLLDASLAKTALATSNPALGDEEGWGEQKNYQTIRTVSIEDKLYLFAKGTSCMRLYQFNPDGNRWKEIEGAPAWKDRDPGRGEVEDGGYGWRNPEHYDTIRAVALNNKLYLLGRDQRPKGNPTIQLHEFNPAKNQWTRRPDGPCWNDEEGWKGSEYYKTIQFVALDGKLYLLARAGNGIQIHEFDPTNCLWNGMENGPAWNDKGDWWHPQYFETIRVATFSGKLYLLARGKSGIQIYEFDPKIDQWQVRKAGPHWGDRDVDGIWQKSEHYKTIQFVTLDDKLYLLARNNNCIEIHQFNPNTNTWMGMTRGPNASKWQDPEYYETIQAVALSKKLYLSARTPSSPSGISIYQFDPSAGIKGTWREIIRGPAWSHSAAWSRENRWDQAKYYETIRMTILNDRLFFVARGREGIVYHSYFSEDDHTHQFNLYTAPRQVLTWSGKRFLLESDYSTDAELIFTRFADVSNHADLIIVNNSPIPNILLNNITQSYFVYGPNNPTVTKLSATSFIQKLYAKLLIGSPSDLYATLAGTLEDMDGTSNFKPVKAIPQLNKVEFDGGFGLYLWEIFFHLPFFIANRLNALQRFAEAREWYHYIFNPLKKSDQAFKFPPLQTKEDGYEYLLEENQNSNHDAIISIYHDHSFDPHMIAQLRPIAYKKVIVMKYIQNLIDWADSLFTLDTRETISQATNLYMMANDLLGKRPIPLGLEKVQLKMMTFNDYLKGGISLNQALDLALKDIETTGSFVDLSSKVPLHEFSLLFGIPENKEFVAYWDRIEDRLFKIRHCLTINGIKQTLDLFDPEIDVNQLVRAAASGNVDMQFFLPATIPNYRFQILLEQTRNFIQQVMQLGSSLLSTIEKQENEDLQLLSLGHQSRLLDLITSTKQRQVDEANYVIEQVKVTANAAEHRRKYYEQLIDKGLISEETHAKTLKIASQVGYGISGVLDVAAGVIEMFPQETVGAAGIFGSPVALTSEGGMNIGAGAHLLASGVKVAADILNFAADDLLQEAIYTRREQEWKQQISEAQDNCEQIAHQLTVANIQAEIAKREYEQYQEQIKQQKEVANYYSSKFTNIDLYRWLMGQIQALYKQAYDLALVSAKKTESAYQFEVNSKKSFIGNNYYSFFRKGLLAGESLMLDLSRLEQAYLDDNKRLYEIQKTISLKELLGKDFKLDKENKTLSFEFPETFFKADLKDHINRRIKRVSVSIPGLAKPYQNTYLLLRQTSNNKGTNDDIVLRPAGEEVVLSTNVNDPGLFSANLEDPRYLPFEGTGAISNWQLELIGNTNINNVIFHLEYTAEKAAGPRT